MNGGTRFVYSGENKTALGRNCQHILEDCLVEDRITQSCFRKQDKKEWI